ncbi:hypothetical protein J437_LFUL009016, partial [Ladona fulva]
MWRESKWPVKKKGICGSYDANLKLILFHHAENTKNCDADLQCTVSSQVPYTLQAYWGVSIRELHLFLWRPWSAMRSAPHGDELFTLFLPRPSDLDLGTPPRLCYPLVIFLVRNDPPHLELHPDETILSALCLQAFWHSISNKQMDNCLVS